MTADHLRDSGALPTPDSECGWPPHPTSSPHIAATLSLRLSPRRLAGRRAGDKDPSWSLIFLPPGPQFCLFSFRLPLLHRAAIYPENHPLRAPRTRDLKPTETETQTSDQRKGKDENRNEGNEKNSLHRDNGAPPRPLQRPQEGAHRHRRPLVAAHPHHPLLQGLAQGRVPGAAALDRASRHAQGEPEPAALRH